MASEDAAAEDAPERKLGDDSFRGIYKDLPFYSLHIGPGHKVSAKKNVLGPAHSGKNVHKLAHNIEL